MPYSTSQYINQSFCDPIDWNSFSFADYNGKFVSVDGNCFIFTDVNGVSGTTDWSAITGFPSGCGYGQAVQIIDTSLTCVDINAFAGASTDNNYIVAKHGADGNWVYYPITTGTNKANGDVLEQAINETIAGDILYLAPATFDIETYLIDFTQKDVSIFGSGKYATKIIATRIDEGNDSVFYISGSTQLKDFTLTSETDNGAGTRGIQTTNDRNGIIELRNLLVDNFSNAVYVTNLVYGGGMESKIGDINEPIKEDEKGGEKGMIVLESGDNFNGNIVDIWDSSFIGEIALTAYMLNQGYTKTNIFDSNLFATANGIVTTLRVNGGVVDVYNSTITATESLVDASNSYGVYNMGTTACTNCSIARINSGTILTEHSATKLDYSLYLVNTNGSNLVASNTIYDPEKISGTNTYFLDSNTIVRSLVSLPNASTSTFLRGDGNWSNIDVNFTPFFNYIDFNLSDGFLQQEGRLQWDNNAGTLMLGMPGGEVNLQMGQELLLRVKNVSGQDINNGNVVFVNGTVDDKPKVRLADADDINSHKVFGVATEDIPNNHFGYVNWGGIVNGLDTSGYNSGDVLYLSQDLGKFTSVEPASPAHKIRIGQVQRVSATVGSILVSMQFGRDLNDLDDVLLSSLSDNALLVFDSGSGLWKNINCADDEVLYGDGVCRTIGSSTDDWNAVMARGNVSEYDVNVFKTSALIKATNTGGNSKTISMLADNVTDASYVKATTGVPASTPYAINIDGSTESFLMSTGVSAIPRTMSMWVKTTDTSGRSPILSLVYNSRRYTVSLENSTGNISVAWGANRYGSVGVTAANDVWHHIVYTYGGDGSDTTVVATAQAVIWRDGTKYTPSYIGQGGGHSGNPRIGFDGTTYFGGTIDQVVMWSRVLTDAEIGDLYNSGNGLYFETTDVFPSTSTSMDYNLMAYWKINDSPASNLSDSSANNYTMSGTGIDATNWVAGKISSPSTDAEVQVIKVTDGVSGSANGTIELGNNTADLVLNGGLLSRQYGGTTKVSGTSLGETFIDDYKQWFGTGSDASLYYDGTNFTINSREVGSGQIRIIGDINMQYSSTSGISVLSNTGTGTNYYRLGTIQGSDGFQLRALKNVAATENVPGIEFWDGGGGGIFMAGYNNFFNFGGTNATDSRTEYARIGIYPSADDDIGLMLRARASQTGDLMQWVKTDGTKAGSINNKGSLQLRQGSTDANTAPIKFTSGNLLSTTEAGTIEFNNDDYYATITTGSGGTATNAYPPIHNDTYVKSSTFYSTQFYPYFATDPAKTLTGSWNNNAWVSQNAVYTNQVFQIDLNSSQVVKQIYYENGHSSGGTTNAGLRAFTFWGSNDANFLDTNYSDNTNWTQLTTSSSEFNQHVASDIADPNYITITNSESYRYYRFKISTNWGNTTYMAVRRLTLQTIPTTARKNIVLTDSGNLISGRIPYSTTNGRLTDKNTLTIDSNAVFFDSVYAGMWQRSDVGLTTTITNTDVYYQIKDFNSGLLNGFIFNDSNLIALYGGVYKVDFTSSVSDGASGEHGWKLFVNDVGQENCYAHLHDSGNAQNVGFSCLIRLVANDTVNVRVDDHSIPASNMVTYSGSVNVLRVGN